MTRWRVDDEVWARYYDMATDRYVARLLGHVTDVGPKGFTVRRVKPDHKGRLIERHPHDVVLWRSREEAEAYLAEHPFSVGPAGKPGG